MLSFANRLVVLRRPTTVGDEKRAAHAQLNRFIADLEEVQVQDRGGDVRILAIQGPRRGELLWDQVGQIRTQRRARVVAEETDPLPCSRSPESGDGVLPAQELVVDARRRILVVEYGEVRAQRQGVQHLVSGAGASLLVVLEAGAEVVPVSRSPFVVQVDAELLCSPEGQPGQCRRSSSAYPAPGGRFGSTRRRAPARRPKRSGGLRAA